MDAYFLPSLGPESVYFYFFIFKLCCAFCSSSRECLTVCCSSLALELNILMEKSKPSAVRRILSTWPKHEFATAVRGRRIDKRRNDGRHARVKYP